MTALAQVRSASLFELLIDLVSAQWPSVSAAALECPARSDVDTFISSISGLDPDPHWSVRAALATSWRPWTRPRAGAADDDSGHADQRVIPSVLTALARIVAPTPPRRSRRAEIDDPVVRAAAARGLATLKAANAAPALIERTTTRRAMVSTWRGLRRSMPSSASPARRSLTADCCAHRSRLGRAVRAPIT